MLPKDLELQAFEHLQVYLQARLPGCSLHPTMNKGRAVGNPHLADAVLEHEGRTYHIEIKASSNKIDHNIRFAHQTVTKAIGKDLIVALISDLGTGSPTFEFFRLSDVAQSLRLEPRFLIAAKDTRSKRQPLETLLTMPEAALDVSNLLDSPVRKHMNSSTPLSVNSTEGADKTPAKVDAPDWTQLSHPLWSPYASGTDTDGDPYPPWLRYPNLPRSSMGWRMGEGETYAEEFDGWLARQPASVVQAYQAKYPAPHDWKEIWPKNEA